MLQNICVKKVSFICACQKISMAECEFFCPSLKKNTCEFFQDSFCTCTEAIAAADDYYKLDHS